MDEQDELRQATTESVNPRTRQIDQLSSQAIVELILQEEAWVIPAVQAERTAIAALADVVVERMRRGGRLVYVGAGTSGRLGMLDAIECIPTYGLEPGRIVALVAGGPAALTGPVEAAEDDEEAGARELTALGIGPDDVVLGISASGRTPYVRGALREARQRGAYVAVLVCNRPAPLADLAD
jgi:N-acetylmuramic acid 6-phosphate etherase